MFKSGETEKTLSQRNSIPLLRMHQTLIFGQDVAKSKDAR